MRIIASPVFYILCFGSRYRSQGKPHKPHSGKSARCRCLDFISHPECLQRVDGGPFFILRE